MRTEVGVGLFALFTALLVNLVSSQTQSVQLCPLWQALQNRCPTQPTMSTSTIRTTTNSNDSSSESADVVDDTCGYPMITFCPAMQQFFSGRQNCTSGSTIQIKLTTLGRLLTNPSRDKAAEIVGTNYVDNLGETFESVSKTIQATATQATGTIGVTFIPVGQIIG